MEKISLAKIIFISCLSLMAALITTHPVLANSAYQAQRIEQSHAFIPELAAGQTLEFWVKFKNTGSAFWSGSGSETVTLRTVSGMKSKFSHLTWPNGYTPNQVNPALTIYPGDEALFRFTLQAPGAPGLHWEKFNLFAGSNQIQGANIEIAIKVIGASREEPSVPAPAPAPSPAPAPAPEPKTEPLFWQSIPTEISIATNLRWQESEGPEIKVGLLFVTKEEKKDYLPFRISTLVNALYDIYDGNNKLLVRNTAGEPVEIDYDYEINRYFVNDSSGKRLVMTDSYLKLQPPSPAIFKISSWQTGAFWDGGQNDNEFRGYLEVRYNPSTERLWLINELPMETYLKGLGEASDASPTEFIKAQAVAARTYAVFRSLNPKYTNTPDGAPLFTLQATQADQVYRGYKRELRAPNTVSAVSATKGVIAAYQNEPISAYYFAQSDGKTRSSYEAGMTKAPVDYLIAKADPPGEGKTLLGHGVGMPQRSAMTAANQGANFSQILKYYYSGINLTQIY